ncbi:cupin domain-containing protein [Parasphingorhabdus sp.]|uniref:cupin domain-containing protein n=1 Tax=Parasphingorhabdus sp. TaxID=2709688 RepID=UPI003A924B2D
MSEARAIIDQLGLLPHPEGGWFRETWRADATKAERASATAIYFLLEAAQKSHWHRVDATELWLWHAGSPLSLRTAADDSGPVVDVSLGPNILGGEAPQHLIPTGHWQAAQADRGWTLVSCIVSPAFEFAGFELAAAGWSPGS